MESEQWRPLTNQTPLKPGNRIKFEFQYSETDPVNVQGQTISVTYGSTKRFYGTVVSRNPNSTFTVRAEKPSQYYNREFIIGLRQIPKKARPYAPISPDVMNPDEIIENSQSITAELPYELVPVDATNGTNAVFPRPLLGDNNLPYRLVYAA